MKGIKMSEKKKIRPLQREIKSQNKNVLGAFDIETEKLFGKYLDGFLKYDDSNIYYRAESMEKMFDLIMQRWNVTLYAHNASGYEFNYLIDVLKKKDDINISLIVTGTKIIGMIIIDKEDKKKRIELRDSFALFSSPPLSLKDACKAFNVKGGKTDIGLSEGVIYDPNNVDHQEYCKNDVWCTIEVVKNFTSLIFETFGCGIGFTAASTALAAWKTTIPKENKYYRIQRPVEEVIRKSYYGGITYPGKTIHVVDDIFSIDRNAAYAASMKMGVPYGKPYYTSLFKEDFDGIYYCWVETPIYSEDFMPIIPFRDDKGLKWPIGKFYTYITSLEILYAREHGYKIEVIEGYVFLEHIYPFNDFIDKCQKIEVDEPDKKPVIKICRNSCYGKFGTKLIADEYIIGDIPVDGEEEWIPLVDEETGEINFSVYSRKVENTSNYIFPHWAAWITANQRLWMLDIIYRLGPKNVVYGDTDSVKAKRECVEKLIKDGVVTISTMYGDCKVDEKYKWFQCLGPKVYHGKLTNDKDKMRAKGLPYKKLSRELFEMAYNNVFPKVEYISSNTTLARLKKPNKSLLKEAERCMTNFRESKSWEVTINGEIIPPTIIQERNHD